MKNPSTPSSGPSLFCEWVVGQTIESALRRQARREAAQNAAKAKGRNVITLEVTTDDESDTDSIKITYPRTGRKTLLPAKAGEQVSTTIVKKVRFDEPVKSALKKSDEPKSESSSSSTPVDNSSDADSISGTDEALGSRSRCSVSSVERSGY